MSSTKISGKRARNIKGVDNPSPLTNGLRGIKIKQGGSVTPTVKNNPPKAKKKKLKSRDYKYKKGTAIYNPKKGKVKRIRGRK